MEAATTAAQTESDLEAVIAWEDLLLAIRKDLGHDDSNLARGELLRIFMAHIDEHLPADRGHRQVPV